ncbi:hypothetical protein NA57DRAFT_80966 [Rhizodiscina lignyota]|uniref:Uncharacterized protein n=1 Tax=Rhizodiscina lignyota TaxID=1504668 RepID=A0A9P4I8Z3_9PEZI|nr:hypothetical protein NA57DRAFT_80966 [Rhizodiscina lignyota]
MRKAKMRKTTTRPTGILAFAPPDSVQKVGNFHQQEQSRFCNLPMELRFEIYRNVIFTHDVDAAFRAEELGKQAGARKAIMSAVIRLSRTAKRINIELEKIIPFDKMALVFDCDNFPPQIVMNCSRLCTDHRLLTLMGRAEMAQLIATNFEGPWDWTLSQKDKDLTFIMMGLQKIDQLRELVVTMKCRVGSDKELAEELKQEEDELRAQEDTRLYKTLAEGLDQEGDERRAHGHAHPYESLVEDLVTLRADPSIIFKRGCDHSYCGPSAEWLWHFGKVEMYSFGKERMCGEMGEERRCGGYLEAPEWISMV